MAFGHTVTRCTPSACGGAGGGTGSDTWTDSGTLHQGQTYSHTFTGPGTYVYYCAIHGYAQMHGTVIVTGGSSPPPAAPVAVSKLKLQRGAHQRESVSFTLSAPAMVKIVVRRAARKYRAQTLSGHAGQNSAELSTRGLRRGRYTLSVTPEGGKAVQATFTL